MNSSNSEDAEYAISQLERALEMQENREGEIVSDPPVAYCFDCDEITVDDPSPAKCIDHRTVMSDGYEHGGIDAAITAIKAVHGGEQQ